MPKYGEKGKLCYMDTGIHGSSTGKLKFEDYIHSSKATQLENKKY